MIRSRPPWPQVTRKLTSPFPSLPHSKFPTPRGFPELNMRLTKTTSQFSIQGPEQTTIQWCGRCLQMLKSKRVLTIFILKITLTNSKSRSFFCHSNKLKSYYFQWKISPGYLTHTNVIKNTAHSPAWSVQWTSVWYSRVVYPSYIYLDTICHILCCCEVFGLPYLRWSNRRVHCSNCRHSIGLLLRDRSYNFLCLRFMGNQNRCKIISHWALFFAILAIPLSRPKFLWKTNSARLKKHPY